MGRKKNHEDAVLEVGRQAATCPNLHELQRTTAEADYECDACSADVLNGACFFGCRPCDYSLCGGCYVKLATNTLEGAPAQNVQQQRAAADKWAALAFGITPQSQRVDDDVYEFCEKWGIDERVMKQLNELMMQRQDTFASDLEFLWEDMETCRNPGPGLLITRIKQMREGTFVGKSKLPKALKDMIEKYRLDKDARVKLTHYIIKQDPDKAKRELEEVERRLATSGKPSATAMTCIVKLFRGEPLPPVQNTPSHRDFGTLKKNDEPRGKGGAPDDRVRDDRRGRDDRCRDDRCRDERGRDDRARNDYGRDDHRGGWQQGEEDGWVDGSRNSGSWNSRVSRRSRSRNRGFPHEDLGRDTRRDAGSGRDACDYHRSGGRQHDSDYQGRDGGRRDDRECRS